MNIKETRDLVIELEQKSVISEEDEFKLVEALMFLFNETKETKYIVYLGGYYYEKKNFDLALKYYEMATELGHTLTNLYLGYIWYYGRTGTKDYKKAFECFEIITKAKIGKDHEHGKVSKDDVVEAKLKLADMYKNGYYVSKDLNKYKSIINQLFKEMKDFYKNHDVFKKYIEVGLRKARILEEEEKIDDALNIYFICKNDLAIRLMYNLFFGDVNQMGWVVNDIYRLTSFDLIDFDLYDLFYLLKAEEHIIEFTYDNKGYTIESKKEENGTSYRLEDKWYHSFNDLLLYGSIDNESLPFLYGHNLLDNYTILK